MKVWRALAAWLGIGLIAITIVLTHFNHPELTETQLFLTFWPRWLMVLIIAGAVAAVLRRTHG